MRSCLPVRRATNPQWTPMAAVLLAVGISITPTAAQATDPLALVVVAEDTRACSIAPEPLTGWLGVDALQDVARRIEPHAVTTVATRSLVLAAESRVDREDAWEPFVSVSSQTLTAAPDRTRGRLWYPGRAWPFALAATADAATTYWGLRRGASERNPLLAFGRLDVGMVKIVQFPLLAMASDYLQAAHPRWGRPLRWVIFAFHAALAVNNVRLGRSVSPSDVNARARRH
jgi:hypothetical protein